MSFFKKLGKGLKRVASVVNPVAGFAYDLVGGKGVKGAAKGFVDNAKLGQSVALKLLPVAASGGLAAPASLGSLGSSLGSLGSAGGGIGGALTSVGKFALDNPDLILGGLSAAEGYDANRKANRYRGKAISAAEQAYAERAPLRQAGLAGLLDETRPDLSGVFATSNPMARPFKRLP